MSQALFSVYPDTSAERDRWIVAQRGPRNTVSATQPYAFMVEPERLADGSVGDVATVFLTNRECPWRCVMCDLWRNTLPAPVAAGDIPRQIAYALERLPSARQIKLYNSGSFFDRGAIPAEDHAAIASMLQGFERVIVECHPALISPACARFRDLTGMELEIAMGLETVHPETLEKLNKRMTVDQYATAAGTLADWDIALRSFVLLQPPFLAPCDGLAWTCRSIDFARECAATAVAIIPTRGGNGAMEAISSFGDFSEPSIPSLETAMEHRLGQGNCRIFADLWEIDRFACCPSCRSARQNRLQRMNRTQTPEPGVRCRVCEDAS